MKILSIYNYIWGSSKLISTMLLQNNIIPILYMRGVNIGVCEVHSFIESPPSNDINKCYMDIDILDIDEGYIDIPLIFLGLMKIGGNLILDINK